MNIKISVNRLTSTLFQAEIHAIKKIMFWIFVRLLRLVRDSTKLLKEGRRNN